MLYISYNGMLDPLGQSQVLPYLRGLSKRGVRFTLMSFERHGAWQVESASKVESLRRSLAASGIEWHPLRYHQRPSLPATAYDVLTGIRHGARLVRRHQIEMVHARNPVMATIALALKKLLGIKMIFDVRGLLADEYVDAGHWPAASFKYRLTQFMESRCLAAADGLVTLTQAIWPLLKASDELSRREVAHQVIPCCVDLERFRFDAAARAACREELGLQDRFVLVYSGSVGTWYLTEEMADFFAVLSARRSDAHFLWLTPSDQELIEAAMRRRGIAPDRYTVRAVAPPADVSSYLSASDAGIAFIKPCRSKLASSPTKVGEYLACGLPLIINANIGDCDALVSQERVGALVREFTAAAYEQAATTMLNLLDDVESTRRRSREVAERLLDVNTVGLDHYARLYEDVFARPGARPDEAAPMREGRADEYAS